MKKLVFITVLFLANYAQSQTTTQVEEPVKPPITISKGTEIKVSLNEDISGKEVSTGQKIYFTLSDDLIQGNDIVLAKGLKVMGTVTEAAKSKGLGKKGKLSFDIEYLYLNNGKVVKLSSQIKKNINGSGAVVVTTAVLLSPFALFIHGKNAKYKKGEVFSVFIDEDYTF